MMDAMKYFGSPVHFSIEKNQLLEIYPNPEKKTIFIYRYNKHKHKQNQRNI